MVAGMSKNYCLARSDQGWCAASVVIQVLNWLFTNQVEMSDLSLKSDLSQKQNSNPGAPLINMN